MKEKLQMKLAWLMPKWLVYFCAIRVVAFATMGQYSSTIVSKLSAMDAIERWGTIERKE